MIKTWDKIKFILIKTNKVLEIIRFQWNDKRKLPRD